jgi:hypothetical protein
MEEPTIPQIINGFRLMPMPIEERAAALATYLSSGDRTVAAVERIDGSMVHIVRSTLLEDFDTWRLNGMLGDPCRDIRHRFRIDMDPTTPLDLIWEERNLDAPSESMG